MTRTYIDVHGRTRTATFIERVDGLVEWRKGHPPSEACRWRLDNGAIVQIPDDAWNLPSLSKIVETNEKPTQEPKCYYPHANPPLKGL
jgi:hypothetical protein